MEGNFFSSHGRYTEAIASYLRAQDYDEARPYAEFGLGSVYFALDEKDAALERFAVAEEALRKLPGGYEDLLYHIHYNSGVVRFRAEDFTGAADEFIAALKAGSTHIEAKRNLELSLLSLERGSSGVSAEEEPQVSDQNATLFEYLRQKEQDLWKSQEWIEEAAASGPDY
jgi:tetratricopeptide (TPR) repeat protein